jgi:3-dehydroquinate dehydratase/shikimate dehydrogenase
MNQNFDIMNQRMLGVGLGPRDTGDVLSEFATLGRSADIIELRLDLMSEYDLRTIITESPLPLIITNRPVREGGQYAGHEEDRISVLLEALEVGAQYIDVELDAINLTPKNYRHRMIVSHHDYEKMPTNIEQIQKEMLDTGSAVSKIVGLARSPEDSFIALRAIKGSSLPTISIAMGPHGLTSRVLALLYEQCFLTYGTPKAGKEVAPGQLSLATLEDVYLVRALGTETASFVVVVDRANEVLIRDLNVRLRHREVDAVAVPLEARDVGETTLDAFRHFGFRGAWDLQRSVVTGGNDWELAINATSVECVAEWWREMLGYL